MLASEELRILLSKHNKFRYPNGSLAHSLGPSDVKDFFREPMNFRKHSKFPKRKIFLKKNVNQFMNHDFLDL